MKKNHLHFPKASLLFFLLLLSIAYFQACKNNETETKKPSTPSATTPAPDIKVPTFNADSAYQFVAKQVSFGSRVPGTTAHDQCGQWLQTKLGSYADSIFIQEAPVSFFDKKTTMKNIIGTFNTTATRRILLLAHWDSRLYADQDTDEKNHNQPVMGANDGASGVGVLLEIARQLQQSPISKNLGVDILLVDAEDNGNNGGNWCLGSQHWAKNPHVPNYKAEFGILLDMVGAKDAVFNVEGYSAYFAPRVVQKVWSTANKIGYSSYFQLKQVNEIIDDHFYINDIAKIPTIDIIQYDPSVREKGFPEHWHTVHDTMENIDKNTLKAVGQTVLTVLYNP
ncbi:MAG: M28 family peptidase [Chitinophagales bacterium]|nr:M28 family peptidase [Bacteroidota bacterium]MCB9043654.1 M28 family peptidase [Chitinophagales bacterium]